jgi:hypothetical protein
VTLRVSGTTNRQAKRAVNGRPSAGRQERHHPCRGECIGEGWDWAWREWLRDNPQAEGKALALSTLLSTGIQNHPVTLENQGPMAERVGFEPKVAVRKTVQEVDGLLPGSAGLLRLATITPRPPILMPPGGLRWDPLPAPD